MSRRQPSALSSRSSKKRVTFISLTALPDAYRQIADTVSSSTGFWRGRKRSRPSAEVETRLREQADRSPIMDDLLASASHLVSRAARHVGFALCDNPVAILQRIEFVALGGSRVLVVVISRGNQITQKVVDTGEEVRPHDLVQAENYLNTEFAGLPLVEVREAVLARLQQERILYDQLLGAR